MSEELFWLKKNINSQEHTQTPVSLRLDKANLANSATLVAKVAKSNLSTKSTLWIKGVRSEQAGRFKNFAHLFNLTHSEFLDLLMATFAEANPTIEDSLSKQVFSLEVKVIELPEAHIAPSIEAENHLKTTRRMLDEGTLSQKALGFRCDTLLRPFLLDKNVPQAQKDEIHSFITYVASGRIRGTE